jgi:hypothetical protein
MLSGYRITPADSCGATKDRVPASIPYPPLGEEPDMLDSRIRDIAFGVSALALAMVATSAFCG